MFSTLGHPVMRPDVGFIELSAGLVFRDSIAPLPEHAAVRAANRTADENRKNEKDDKRAKRWVKERAKLNRGKRQQGSEEEEEEKEEGRRGEETTVKAASEDAARKAVSRFVGRRGGRRRGGGGG